MNKEEKETVEELRKQLRLAINIDDVATTIRNDDAETILNLIEKLQKEKEELNKNYNFLIDKIILKIDEYDYKFEKAKKQNKNDIADYYWDLIINFKKLLGGE